MSSTHHGVRSRHSTVNRRSHGASVVDPFMSMGQPGAGSGPTSTTSPQEVRNVVQGSSEQMPAQQLGEASVGTSAIQNEAVTTEKLLLQDEFGKTMLTASGFVGSWEDYFLTALRNGSFGDNDPMDPATLGRTGDVPYWTLSAEVAVGSPFFRSDEGSVEFVFDTANDALQVASDLIRVRQGVRMGIFLRGVESTGGAAADCFVLADVDYYDLDGDLVDTRSIGSTDFLGGVAARTVVLGSFEPEAAYIAVRVYVLADTLDTGAAGFELQEVGIFVADDPHGDAFYHVSPAVNTRFYRDDLGMEYFQSGAGWYSTALYAMPVPWAKPASVPYTSTTTGADRVIIPVPTGQDNIILTDLEVHFHVASGGTALSASHKWSLAVQRIDDAGTATTIATFDIDSGASNTWRSEKVVLGVEADPSTASGSVQLHTVWTKTGSPGNLTEMLAVSYRYIAV